MSKAGKSHLLSRVRFSLIRLCNPLRWPDGDNGRFTCAYPVAAAAKQARAHLMELTWRAPQRVNIFVPATFLADEPRLADGPTGRLASPTIRRDDTKSGRQFATINRSGFAWAAGAMSLAEASRQCTSARPRGGRQSWQNNGALAFLEAQIWPEVGEKFIYYHCRFTLDSLSRKLRAECYLVEPR